MSSKKDDISEKENDFIEKVAKRIVDSELDPIAMMVLQTIKPVSTIGGELAYFFLAPYLPLLDEKGYDFLDTFEQRKNIEKLIVRVERLNKEKSKEKEANRGSNFWGKLKVFLKV